jgi:hypothetical protein
MSFLSNRNGLSVGVSPYVTLGGPSALYKFAPSLLLDFTNTGTLDPRITFTRASSGTFTGSNGLIQSAAIDAPRFDYNPVTLASNGLLIEEQRTNLVTYSEQFDNAAWGKGNSSITANTIVSPDGTLDADKVVEDTANNTHRVSVSNVSVTSGTAYTFSIFAKAAERSAVQLSFGSDASAFPITQAIFSLTGSGSFVNNGGTPNAVITNLGNGWYRCSVTATASSTTSSGVLRIFVCNGTTAGSDSYTGNGTSGLYIWGAQLEAGAFPTSYIPTVAAQVTRSADVAVMTGTNFSSWYNQTEGTVYAEYVKYANVGSRIVAISNSTINAQIRLTGSVAVNIRPDWQIIDGGTVQANVLAVNTIAPNIFAKSAGAYAVNSFNQATNAVLGVEDTSGTVPPVSQMNIGANEVGIANLNGYIRKIAYYPQRLPNAQLQALTV